MAQDGAIPFGVRDLKVYKISSLSTPTYAAGVDVPYVQECTLDPQVTEAVLNGDDILVSTHAVLDGADWSWNCGGLNLAVWEAVLGATASDSGVTPNEVTYLALKSSTDFPYFGWIAQIHDAEDAGDTHLVAHKAKVNDPPPGTFSYGAYHVSTIGGKALPGPYDNDTIFWTVNHETAVAIPGTWPGVTPYTSS